MISRIFEVGVTPMSPVEIEAGIMLNERYNEAITQVMQSVVAVAPEVVGMTVFGSLSRNEASVKADGSVSDIDGVMVIDADKSAELDGRLEFTENGEICYPTIGRTMLGMTLKVGTQNLLEKTMNTGAMSDVDILIVSTKQLLETPRELLERTPEPEATVQDWTQVDINIKRMLKYFIGRDQTAGLFFPTAFGELDTFRSRALEPLKEFKEDKPQLTARSWSNIRVYVNHFCKGRENDGFVDIGLPATLDEAIEKFC